MEARDIVVVVQGLFEKSDSIGYDAVYEYKMLSDILGKNRVRLFADRYDESRYPEASIEPMADFWVCIKQNPTALIVYHYCDGWPELDGFILESGRDCIVRWHNNTPPWFYGASHRRAVERTVRGFRTIVDFLRSGNVEFWVNSNFSLDQLRALGGTSDCGAVVFPGSRLLEAGRRPGSRPSRQGGSDVALRETPLRLLFVSRVVAHKGHRHIVEFAAYLRKVLRRDTLVTFIGRDDPAAGLKGQLERLAQEHGVELVLEGEVGNDELHAAYLAADVFVCLSEHEGFGMPVFEAMRLDVPVICLGRTALRELMRDHPFMLDELDYARAAAMVKVLEDDADARNAVLAVQAKILKTYTPQVIADQIVAALAGRHGLWAAADGSDDAAVAGEAHSIAAGIDAVLAGGTWPALHFDAAPREFGENFMTIYDLESYETLLEADRGLDRLPDRPISADFAMLSHKEFVSPSGTRLDNGIAFSGLANEGKGHAVYGPYARFGRGFFSADFVLEAEAQGDQDTVLQLEVAGEGRGILAMRKLTVAEIRKGGIFGLFFPVGDDDTIMEFRIRVVARGNCNFLFGGVSIRNQRESLKNLPAVPVAPPATFPWQRRGIRPRPAATRLSGAAVSYFQKGDAFRDRAWWNDAATCYAQGLEIEPRAFAYLVQLGNCTKEAGRLDEAEIAYQRAIALLPDDRDVHLQIGRLYLLLNNREAAFFHLLKAVRMDSAMAQAMHELASTGFDISALPDLFA